MLNCEFNILKLILGILDLSAFTSLKTVYAINSSKFDILTAGGTDIVTLDEAIKDTKPNVGAIQNFTRKNVPYGYVSAYRLEMVKSTIAKAIFSTSSGSTGKPKILEFENKWMGEFPVYTNDVQGPGDIPKLFDKFGESRAMKIAKEKNNLGDYSIRFIFIIVQTH